jgi:hypothetical protein
LISSRSFKTVHQFGHDSVQGGIPHIFPLEDAGVGVSLSLCHFNVEARASERSGKRLEGEEPTVGVFGVLKSGAMDTGGHPKLGHDLLGNERRGTHLNWWGSGKWFCVLVSVLKSYSTYLVRSSKSERIQFHPSESGPVMST